MSLLYLNYHPFDSLLYAIYKIRFLICILHVSHLLHMGNLEIPDKIYDRLVKDMQAITILAFIKENENDRGGLSKERVAKVMREKGICSRPTTLKIIDSLLDQEILLEQGRGFRNSSDLVVSKDFHFKELMKESFAKHYEKLEKSIDPFKPYILDGTIDYNVKKEKGKTKVQLGAD